MPISEWERLHREAARYKEMYPKGTRVVLEHMDDPYPAVPPGTRGTVQDVDSIGQITREPSPCGPSGGNAESPSHHARHTP